MRKEEFYFDSRDNHSKIHAVRWMPDSENVTAVVQIVHGMAEYGERYEAFAKFLTERGFVVTAEDHLGHGKSVAEDNIQGYFCEQDAATVVVRDVHRLKKMTQEIYPGVPYFILGHSMGSFILRNYIGRYGTGIHGAMIVGTGSQPAALLACSKALAALEGFFRGQKHVSRFLDKCAFSGYNRQIKNARTSFDWLSRNTENVDAYLADKDCGFTFTVNGFKTLFTLISRCQKKEHLNNIPKELPLLVTAGAADPVGAYGKGVQKAYEALKKVGIKNLEIKLYPEDRHEILNETDREQVMEDIARWLGKHLDNSQAI